MRDMPDNSFDLVYGRFLIYSYGEGDYIKLVSECKRICKIGGYVEFVELDMTIYGNPVPGSVTRVVNASGKAYYKLMKESARIL
jgi:ubiquinone/menaquinone biosynthesis C-methylase UbiE